MNMHTKHELTLQVLPRYLKANKQEKTKILDEYCANTEYERKYAITKLKEYQMTPNLEFKVAGKHKRNREKVYDITVEEALHTIWNAYDDICAERLHPQMSNIVDKLILCNELNIDPVVELKLKAVSLGTLKLLLRSIRERDTNRVGGTTKPGTLIKSEIPLRVGYWNDTLAGYIEIDLVAHCGSSMAGEFAFTLNITDIATGWFESEAILGKAQSRVFEGIKRIQKRLPFTLLGIDSDNGGEFINWQLLRYCEKENIEFTRSRPYKKNDNAHIEQKNWTTVRKNFGYVRIEDKKRVDIMNEIYRRPLRDYINFFLPSMKCIERKRVGSRIVKKYDDAKTPYQRVLEQDNVSKDVKDKLTMRYNELNPVALRKEIAKLKRKLFN
jgi:hypothetical protein